MLFVVLQAAASDPVPSENDVKAGWVALVVVLLLVVAVVFLLRSFVKQLKKVDAADQAGVYDEKPGSDLPPTTVERDRRPRPQPTTELTVDPAPRRARCSRRARRPPGRAAAGPGLLRRPRAHSRTRARCHSPSARHRRLARAPRAGHGGRPARAPAACGHLRAGCLRHRLR